MARDFVPDSYQNLYDWADRFHTEFGPIGLVLDWPPARITALQDALADIRDKAKAVLDAIKALDLAKSALTTARNDELPEIRREATNIRNEKLYENGMGDALGIRETAVEHDPNTFKPRLTKAVAHPGYVRLTGVKLIATSLNLYSRRKGESSWRLIAAKRVHFPFDDDSPLAQAGTAETREYRAIAVNGDEEFGQPSDIVEVTYAG